MSNSFASTVDLSLRPSIRALRWVFGLHVLCIALLMLAHPPTLPMLGLAVAIMASWLWCRRHPALGFGPRALIRLIWHAEGGWTLHDGRNRSLDAELLPESIMRGSLMVLRFRAADGSRTMTRMLLGDVASDALLHRLRARLSIGSASEKGQR